MTNEGHDLKVRKCLVIKLAKDFSSLKRLPGYNVSLVSHTKYF